MLSPKRADCGTLARLQLRGMGGWLLSAPSEFVPWDAISGAFPALVTPERCSSPNFREVRRDDRGSQSTHSIFCRRRDFE